MSREENESPELNAIAAALSSLAPSTGGLDRDRLMFLAGEAAGLSHQRARRWAWPAAFSTMSAVAATLLAMLLIQPEPQVKERIVYLPGEPRAEAGVEPKTDHADLPPHFESEPAPPPVIGRRPADDDYLRLRDRALTLGLDSWSSGRSAANGAPTESPHNQRELLESVLKSL